QLLSPLSPPGEGSGVRGSWSSARLRSKGAPLEFRLQAARGLYAQRSGGTFRPYRESTDAIYSRDDCAAANRVAGCPLRDGGRALRHRRSVRFGRASTPDRPSEECSSLSDRETRSAHPSGPRTIRMVPASGAVVRGSDRVVRRPVAAHACAAPTAEAP